MQYTIENYETQIKWIQSSIKADENRLENLDKIEEDVRSNHERTIKMRLEGYKKRISEIQQKIKEMQ